MDMIGHEAIGPELELAVVGTNCEIRQVELAIEIGKEDIGAAVATVRDVIRDPGNDGAGDSDHGRVVSLIQ